MQLSVPMILTLGLSGQPIVGADVTGYHGTCTTDLFEQWMALGTFYPFYRNHSEKGTNRREPWTFGAAAEQVARVALQRRYRLLPYLYTLAKESSADGMPIMRPLFFADAKDASLRNQQQAFLLGDQLMIIPKWATNVKYPSGLWTSISLVGENSKYDTYQPDVRIKAGSVLPLGQMIQTTADYTADSLTLITCLDENYKASGSVYSDAGDGYDYQNGNYLSRSFSIKPFGPDSLIMNIHVDSGNLSTASSKYKLGIVTANGIAYTNFTNNNIIKVAKSFFGEFPYAGSIKNIPGKIEAEDYDLGGQGIAYNDADSINNSGKYRPTESVDIETCSEGGFDLAYIASGEWDRYTVNVTIPGTYTLSARVATGVSSKSFHVEMDGVDISGPIAVPNTGSWQTFQTVNVTTPVLTAGIKTMRIMMDSSNFNINYLQFVIKQIISCPNETIPIIATTPAIGNTYQWQLNNGSDFTDITDNTLYNNSNTDTLLLNNATSDLYGNQYRCAVTNNGITSYSSIYTLQFGVSWTGAVSTDWADPANWNCNQLPDSNTDVMINAGLTNYPVVNNPADCRSVYLDKNASLQVNTGQVLNIKGHE